MELQIGYLRNIDIRQPTDSENVTIGMNEYDGNTYGSWTHIKIPARSYEMLEKEIVDRWLDKQKLK